VLGGILVAVAVAMALSLVLRTPFKVDVVRDRATLARIVDEGRVENVYRLQIMNASESAHRYRVGVEGLQGIVLTGSPEVQVDAAQATWVTLAVQVPPETAQQAGPGAHPIRFQIDLLEDGTGHAVAAGLSEKSTFVVPR
jgi:polyferredoxin